MCAWVKAKQSLQVHFTVVLGLSFCRNKKSKSRAWGGIPHLVPASTPYEFVIGLSAQGWWTRKNSKLMYSFSFSSPVLRSARRNHQVLYFLIKNLNSLKLLLCCPKVKKKSILRSCSILLSPLSLFCSCILLWEPCKQDLPLLHSAEKTHITEVCLTGRAAPWGDPGAGAASSQSHLIPCHWGKAWLGWTGLFRAAPDNWLLSKMQMDLPAVLWKATSSIPTLYTVLNRSSCKEG